MYFSQRRWMQLAGIQIINEAAEPSTLHPDIQGLALITIDPNEDGGKTLVLYDAGLMSDAISKFNLKDIRSPRGMMPIVDSIQGMIKILPPTYGSKSDDQSCHGAWEVTRSGIIEKHRGKGIGNMLYQLAIDVAPSGLIMSDRHDVSPAAAAVWKKKTSKRVFDDEDAPKTDDTFDDCKVHEPKDNVSANPLNYAYGSTEFGNPPDVESLKDRHEELIKKVTAGGNLSTTTINKVFDVAVNYFFSLKV